MQPLTRINAIDLLRGIVMIIMALDHTRDYFHSEAFTGDPLNLATTSPFLFFTRWITHFCAPVFVFLSGTSAYLQGLRKPRKQLSLFLIKRGLWLILVEVLIMTLGITFDIHYSTIILQVIWTIGISMFILGLVIRLPFSVVLAIGLLIVAGHNLLDYYESSHTGDFPVWYQFLHRQGGFALSDTTTVMIFYPFLPWTGVMILGYCFGRFYLSDILNRHKRSMALGAALVIVFIILRSINLYGNPFPWATQKTSLYTFLSFINAHKYPPSLLFICMTIGPSLILLGLVGETENRLTKAVTVFGRVPLFYYIIHFYVLHLFSAIAYLMRGHTVDEGLKGAAGSPFKFLAPGEGYGLAVVYAVWIVLILLLYPLCKWYAAYKAEKKKWYLSYL